MPQRLWIAGFSRMKQSISSQNFSESGGLRAAAFLRPGMDVHREVPGCAGAMRREAVLA